MKSPNFFLKSDPQAPPPAPTTVSGQVTPTEPAVPTNQPCSETYPSGDEKEPVSVNLLETKGISAIMNTITQRAAPEAKKILKIFTKFIYNQGSKKNETAESILYELRGLSRALIDARGDSNPLITKYRYTLSVVYEQLCKNFGFDRIKINSAYGRHVNPISSIFLPILFSSAYGLSDLYPLLDRPPVGITRDCHL